MISGIVTALLLVLFIGGWIWAWKPEAQVRIRRGGAHAPGRSSELNGEDRR